MSRGLNVAVLLVLTSLSISMLGGLGFYDEVGVSINPGVDNDTKSAEDEVASEDLPETQGRDGVLSRISGVWNTLTAFWDLVINTSVYLEAFGVDGTVATVVARFFKMLFGLFLLGVAIRFRVMN